MLKSIRIAGGAYHPRCVDGVDTALERRFLQRANAAIAEGNRPAVAPSPTAALPPAASERRPTPATNPAERGFVLQVAPDCDPSAGRLAGRLLHLRTSDGGNFDSVESLLTLLWRVLERAGERG